MKQEVAEILTGSPQLSGVEISYAQLEPNFNTEKNIVWATNIIETHRELDGTIFGKTYNINFIIHASSLKDLYDLQEIISDLILTNFQDAEELSEEPFWNQDIEMHQLNIDYTKFHITI